MGGMVMLMLWSSLPIAHPTGNLGQAVDVTVSDQLGFYGCKCCWAYLEAISAFAQRR